MTRSALIATIAAATAIAGCGGSDSAATNKAGAPVTSDPQILFLEQPSGGSDEALHFAKRVEARSGGALRVEIVQSYPSALPGNEARLARAIRDGKVGFGWFNGRAWETAGVPAFAVLQAPFVLGDHDVTRRAMAGPAGVALTDALERAGVVPIGLVPLVPRRVLAVKPVVTKADFRGLRVRIYDNATSAADLRALGARPVEGVDADRTLEQLKRGRLDAVETGNSGAVNFKFWRDARHITAFGLFESADTIVAAPAAWERLSESQQAVVRAAAQDAVRFSATLPERDAESLEQLCRAGVRVHTPAAAQLEAISAATEPVRARLRSDPATAEVMRMLEATEGAGPKVLPTPAGCSAAEGRGVDEAQDLAAIPNGVYVVTTTRKDHERFGETSPVWSVPSFTWTTRLRDGEWVRTAVPRPADQAGDVDGAGSYEVHGDEVTFRYRLPVVDASAPETLRWSYYDGRLTLENVDVADRGAQIIYTAHPWRKVR